jgi:hypothetical protein
MTSIPAKVAKRISDGLKRFQPIVDSARARDINESDTVTIVTDILQNVLGYDKYSEITSEHEIRGTYCDLALKLEGELTLLIEVKAIGLELKDQYIKQAVDYAANQGVEWVEEIADRGVSLTEAGPRQVHTGSSPHRPGRPADHSPGVAPRIA